ncbi:hypothetical protein NDU88_004087 [Pleurodeles waltl]|uniref:Uncharacterized protein n=1 Tax=Pleurodeles waltl TaxID=8319 RepID=A0AAV7LKB1_PLEWA|nr:hypothetical protein NDU88_004087 [Pleurodeles waltl]
MALVKNRQQPWSHPPARGSCSPLPAASAPRTVLTRLLSFPRLFSPTNTGSAPRPCALDAGRRTPRTSRSHLHRDASHPAPAPYA